MKAVRDSAYKSKKNREITLPNQIDFNVDHWSNHFRASKSRTLAEERIYKAGLWFHEHSKPVQKQTIEVFDNLFSTGSNKDLLRLQVGMINFRASKMPLHNYIDQNLNQSSISVIEAHNLAGMAEAFITAARYPIAEVFRRLSEAPNQVINKSHDLLALLDLAIDLAISYDSLENIWNECLWNGWYFDEKQSDELLRPIDLKREEIYQINLLRWRSLFELVLIAEWQSSPVEVQNAVLALPRISVELVNDCKEIYLKIRNPFLAFYETRLSLADIAAALFRKQDFYPDSLFDKPLPKISNLTLSQLLAAWRFIATLASDIKAQLLAIEDEPTEDDLLRFSPVFSRTALVKLLAEVFSWLNVEQASRIIELLTFRNKPSDDLWHRPLIKVNDEQLTAIFMALDSPNLSRVISGWMEEGGLKIDKKGHEFEQVARNKLHKNNELSNAKVYTKLKEFRVGKNEEEIDLILRVGKKIIVCELKCTLFPSAPYQIHNYYQDLKEGVIQAKKKSDFVRNNLKIFVDKIGLPSQSIEECRVLPLVISNLPLATGYAFQNIPIIDLKILEDYLSDGRFTLYSRMSEQGLQPLRQVIQVFSSEGEAEERIEDCLGNLPQIKEYRNNIRWEGLPICVNQQDEPIAFQMTAIIQLPQEIYQS